ncbi:MAG: DUF4102 domain-containing protein, partial [Betaproteobacteria bacterium]|nr:DUF4102 domain-containing protein [Betaproteobacteria bacterium]
MALTDLEIRTLKARGKAYEVSDGFGLSVRVSATGVRTFQYRYPFHRKPVRLKLGSYPSMSLADARRALLEARSLVDQGVSPAYQRRLQKAAAKAEAGAESV